MAGINFVRDLNREFYSAYRPIVLKISAIDTDIAFIRGELFVQDAGGSYVSTGVLMNGFNQNGTSAFYELNIMEYTRPYCGSGMCAWFNQIGFMLPGKHEAAKVKLLCWPVRYSTTAIGQLVDDFSEQKYSQEAVVVAANLDELKSNGMNDVFEFMDRFVLGQNGPSVSPSDGIKPLTNMPMANLWGDSGFDGWPTNYAPTDPNVYPLGISVDVSDNPTPSFYYLHGDKIGNTALILLRDINGGAFSSFYFVPVGMTLPHQGRIPVHPIELQTFIQLHMGISTNMIVDASGNLLVSSVFVTMLYNNQGITNYWGYFDRNQNLSARYHVVHYTDRANGVGNCKADSENKVRLHWQNSLGGHDWFNFYGTLTKSVKTSGTQYEKFRPAALRGMRGGKDLWKKRVDEWKVVSQPINSETAIWLQELLSSPLAWMEVELTDNMSLSRWGVSNQLVAISITPGSYEVYNTENNLHYLEFSFTLASNRTQQRG
tara:strand:+ start:566 stop:2026 length:1461 start_codon:yes stop_codon:yes gene_type:complete